MQEKFAKLLVEAAKDNSLDLSLREQYSGCGMYGKDTAAIVGEYNDLAAAIALVAPNITEETDYEDFVESMSKLQIDSMGKRLVFY